MSRKRTQSPDVTPAQKIDAGRVTPEQIAKIDATVARALSPENRTRLERKEESEDRVGRLFRTGAGAAAPAPAEKAADGARETPTSNTGLTAQKEPVPTIKLVMSTSGEIVEYPMRRGWGGDAAFIDWVSFTFHKDTCAMFGQFLQCDDDYVLAMSLKLEQIFGFGVTGKRPNGAHFFRQSWDLGDGFGLVCIGGQRNKILVSLTGKGCAAAEEGWEERLVNFLQDQAEQPKLTRVDLAYDDYLGERYTVDKAFDDYKTDLYQCYRGNAPECEQMGNWYRPSGKGRTFCVGLRRSGKYARIYERGKKEGCKESPWVRIECENKAVGRVLPFDMLMNPGAYLSACYPAFEWISEKQSRITTTKLEMEIAVDRAIEIINHQYGKYIGTLVHVLGQDEFLRRTQQDGVPKRLKVPTYTLSPAPLTLSDRSRLLGCEVVSLPVWEEDIPFDSVTATSAPWRNPTSDGAYLS
ncbi:replication initiation factor domain-containing protein [Silvimonas amylolytica]|uniref:Replication initiation protein-like C-terminal domain-containing protein n=1 Tax=Silvimonas amylolytica TaxID=449663 RepID=A0ABQ2PFU5_9NEIS|nr:replication initiation factor domain-containing protein [Silvimonas amylolytica]GGP24433.1 hypothetical protein GCM10010971_02520 [Silvimonas amylolytica]GGP28342.1 hypothetical protein GCM10010971_41610 [Silvimonas amylolytica]